MTAPSVNDVRFLDEHRVHMEIADGPALTKSYGQRTYRVEVATVVYQRRNVDPWTVLTVELAGRFLKKDGSYGVESTRDRMWRNDWQQMDWLSDLVERYQPAADQ